MLSEAALDTGGGVLTKTPRTEKGIDYGNDDDDPETGATKPPGNTKASVESSGNQEAGNGATQPPRTTEVSPVPEMGLPKDEASGQSFLSHTQTLEVGWGTKLDQRLSHYFDEPTKTLRVVNGNYESFENH